MNDSNRDEESIGYSIKMSMDGKTANVQVRQDNYFTVGELAVALEDIAIEIRCKVESCDENATDQ